MILKFLTTSDRPSDGTSDRTLLQDTSAAVLNNCQGSCLITCYRTSERCVYDNSSIEPSYRSANMGCHYLVSPYVFGFTSCFNHVAKLIILTFLHVFVHKTFSHFYLRNQWFLGSGTDYTPHPLVRLILSVPAWYLFPVLPQPKRLQTTVFRLLSMPKLVWYPFRKSSQGVRPYSSIAAFQPHRTWDGRNYLSFLIDLLAKFYINVLPPPQPEHHDHHRLTTSV